MNKRSVGKSERLLVGVIVILVLALVHLDGGALARYLRKVPTDSVQPETASSGDIAVTPDAAVTSNAQTASGASVTLDVLAAHLYPGKNYESLHRKQKVYVDSLRMLAVRESSGNARAVNRFGYSGLWQMGEPALIDLGYYKRDGTLKQNDWKGEWTGKSGINSHEDFLQNTKVQTQAVAAYHQSIWNYLEKTGLAKYEGRTITEITSYEINSKGKRVASSYEVIWGPVDPRQYPDQKITEIKLTKSGMIAAAHLIGAGGLYKFLKNEEATPPMDGGAKDPIERRTPVTKYLKEFEKLV